MRISDKIKVDWINKSDLFAVAAFVSIVLILFRNIIFTKGFIEFGDFTVPTTLDNYLHFYYPSWNEFGSFSTFQFTNRILTYGPFLLISAIFSIDISTLVKFLAIFPLVISFVSMYIASGICLKANNENIRDKYLIFFRFFAAYVFALNPWVVSEIRHFSLIWGYSFFPLILVLSIFYFKKEKTNKKAIIVIPLLLSLSSVTPNWIVFNALTIFSVLIYTSIFQLKSKQYKKVIENITKFVAIMGIYASFNAYWIVQYILANRYVTVEPTYIYSNEVIDMLSRNSNFINVLGLNSDWWPQADPVFQGYESLWIISSFMLIGLTLLLLIYETKDLDINYLGLVLIFALTLSMGSKNSLPDLYYYLSFDLPLISSRIGWVFRNPTKWASIIAATYSFSIFFLLYKVYIKKLQGKKDQEHFLAASIIVIALSFIFYTYPTIVGYSENVLNPVQIPEEYNDVNSWLLKQEGEFKTLWAPPYNGKKSTWSEGHMLGAFDTISSSKPAFSAGDPDTTYYLYYLYNNYESSNLNKYVGPLNIKYIVYHQDVIGGNELQGIKHDNSIKNINSYGFISVYENPDYTPHINVIPQKILVFGGLDRFTSLINIGCFSPSNTSIYFADQLVQESFSAENSDICILPNEIYPNVIGEDYLIKLFDKTTHHDPKNRWSKAATNEPLHGSWHYYLEKNGIQNWQFDYGKGLVLTWANNTSLTFPIKTEKTDEYTLLIRYFENQRGESINVYLDGKPINVETKNQLNQFIWKDLGTYHLEKGKHEITLENVRGFNSVNLFALIPERKYQETQSKLSSFIQNKKVIYLFEAESDLYRRNSVVQRADETSTSEVLALGTNGHTWKEIEVLKKDSYIMAVKGKGNLEVFIDGTKHQFNSQEFNLKYFGPFELENGKHIIEVTSSGETNEKDIDENESYLDVIWLYSTANSEKFEDIFSSYDVPAEVTNYEKVDSTKYKVHVKASAPYMLSFAESYDPLWIAEIETKNGVKKYNSIPLYSVSNGFWIDETGEYTITIRYMPQQWFYYGVIVSALSSIICMGYLFYKRGRTENHQAKMECVE